MASASSPLSAVAAKPGRPGDGAGREHRRLQPVEGFLRVEGRLGPEAERLVAGDAAGEPRRGQVRVIVRQQGGDGLGRGGGEPGERLRQAAQHRLELGAAGLHPFGAAGEAGVAGDAAMGGAVPDMGGAGLLGQGHEGLEDLDHVELAGGQRGEVLRHGPVGDAGEAGGVEAGLADVLLQGPPGRRHLGHGAEAEAGEIASG